MKKQRPHKASTAAGRRKAKPGSQSARASTAAAPLRPLANSPLSGPEPWAWFSAGSGAKAAPGKRAKGPPPRPALTARAPARQTVVAPRTGAATKLSPALAARLAKPLPTPSPPLHNRFAAALLLVPTLLTAGLLLSSPREKPPVPSSEMAMAPLTPPSILPSAPPLPPITLKSWRVSPAPTPPLSFASADTRPPQTQVPLAAASAQSRPGSRPTSVADTPSPDIPPSLDVAAVSAFARPPERLAPTVPVAIHDLSSAVAALTIAAQSFPPGFVRPPEASVALAPQTEAPEALVAAIPAPLAPADAAPTGVAALPPPPDVPLPPMATTSPQPPDIAVARSCQAAPGLLQASAAPPRAPVDPDLVNDPLKFGRALAAAARQQTRSLVVYNAAYMTIAYPGGDVPLQFGVCTDVIIRAYRELDIDLQQLVHITRRGASDRNIDHRRTELLRGFFATHGEQLPVSPFIEDYLPGDIVTYYRPQNKSSTAHIALVSDVTAPSGRPMIVHNRGWGVQLEDALFVDQMTGHYRFRGLRTTPPLAVAAAAKVQQQTTRTAPDAGDIAAQSDAAATSLSRKPAATALRIAAMRTNLAGTRMGLGAPRRPLPR